MILLKRTTNIALLTVALNTPNVYSQSNDLQSEIHDDLKRYVFADPKGEQWENSKKVLTGYSRDQLVRAIIAELEDDRGSQHANDERDLAAGGLFRVLNLPRTLVCEELDKQLTPLGKL